MRSGISKKLEKFYKSWTKSQVLIIGLYILTFLVFFYVLGLLPNNLHLILGTKDKPEFLEFFLDYSKFVIFDGGGLIIGIEILYFIMRKFKNKWWIVTALILLILVSVYTFVWRPISRSILGYGDFEPLRDPTLRKEFDSLLQKSNLEIDEIYLINSNKSPSAYLDENLGEEIIVFNSNFLANFTVYETKSAFAHELSHVSRSDDTRQKLFNLLLIFIGCFLIHILYKKLLKNYKAKIHEIYGIPILILSVIIILSLLFVAKNNFIRSFETKADRFGLELNRDPDSWISFILKLYGKDLENTEFFYFESDPIPHPIMEFLLYTHPPEYKRIAMAMEYYE